MGFKQAIKHEAKLRMAIDGPSGSGKTFTSLALATALAAGGKIALVDTEHGSAAKYADVFTFDVMEMEPPFHPDRFIAAIKDAEAGGYAVLILDSLTHAWNGSGGLLEIVDEVAKRMKTTNTFAAWKDATPIQNRFVDAIIQARLHIIATMRSKQEYVLEAVQRDGRTVQTPRKVGMAPVQREGFEYEFDIVGDMDIDNNLIVAKTRCPAITGKVFAKPGKELAGIIAEWLHGAPAPVVTSTTTAATTPTNGNGQHAEDAPEFPHKPDMPSATPAQIQALGIGCDDAYGKNWEKDADQLAKVRAWMKRRYGVVSRKDLDREQAADMLRELERLENGEA